MDHGQGGCDAALRIAALADRCGRTLQDVTDAIVQRLETVLLKSFVTHTLIPSKATP